MERAKECRGIKREQKGREGASRLSVARASLSSCRPSFSRGARDRDTSSSLSCSRLPLFFERGLRVSISRPCSVPFAPPSSRQKPQLFVTHRRVSALHPLSRRPSPGTFGRYSFALTLGSWREERRERCAYESERQRQTERKPRTGEGDANIFGMQTARIRFGPTLY